MRELAAVDRERFLAAMRASRAYHRPWLQAPTTEEELDALVRRTREGSFESLVLLRSEGHAVLGYFNLSNIVRGPFQNAFLGYAGVAGEGGRGLMTQGLRLVLRHAFLGLRLHRLEANVQPQNVRSIALLRRCGFVKEGFSERYLKVGGRWADHERWAIRREQWEHRLSSG